LSDEKLWTCAGFSARYVRRTERVNTATTLQAEQVADLFTTVLAFCIAFSIPSGEQSMNLMVRFVADPMNLPG